MTDTATTKKKDETTKAKSADTDPGETKEERESRESFEARDALPDVVLDVTSNDVTVGVVHRRHADVEVPEYDDLSGLETIEADPVDYFQVAGSPIGAVFSFNGAAYSLQASQVAAFKAALDRTIAGLSL